MLKIAFATGDGLAVDQHFGWCRRFDVYQVSAAKAEFLESRLLLPAGAGERDKIENRLAQVMDCAVLHVCEIGGPAAARVISARIHPVKVAQGTPVADLLRRLQAVLAGNPPPWLRKVLLQQGQRTDLPWAQPACGPACGPSCSPICAYPEVARDDS